MLPETSSTSMPPGPKHALARPLDRRCRTCSIVSHMIVTGAPGGVGWCHNPCSTGVRIRVAPYGRRRFRTRVEAVVGVRGMVAVGAPASKVSFRALFAMSSEASSAREGELVNVRSAMSCQQRVTFLCLMPPPNEWLTCL